MSFEFKPSDIELVRDKPATTLGHLCGKTLLTKLHNNWIKYVWDTNEFRSLQAHRGSYKTTAVTIIGSIRWMLFFPNDRISIFRKPYTEAANTLYVIKNLMKLEQIQALFKYVHGAPPKLVVGKENKLVYSFKKTETPEGNINAYGLDGSYTGTHCDKGLIDDAITLKDRISKAERESTKNQIREIQANVIDRGKGMGFVGTPWHKDDGWSIVEPPTVYPVSDTGLISEEEIMVIRSRTTPMLYDCNYNLIHSTNADAIFSDPVFEPWDRNQKVDSKFKAVAHLDAAFDGDCTNALTIMLKRIKDDFISAVGFTFNENVKTKIAFIADKLEWYKVKIIYIETNADKGYTADLLRAEFKTRGKNIMVKDYHEDMNKTVKIANYLKHYWLKTLWAPETQDDYMAQVCDYREGQKPDDCPDSAASLLREAFYKGNNSALWDL